MDAAPRLATPAANTAPNPPEPPRIIASNILAPIKKVSVVDLSFNRFDNFGYTISFCIAKQAITAFLPSAVLFNSFEMLLYIVKSPVKKLRHVIHNAIDCWIAVNQYHIFRLSVMPVIFLDNILSFSPKRERAMRIIFGNPIQVF